MVPNGRASKVDVEVSETTFHAHQTVPVLHFRVLHLRNGVCGFRLLLLQVLRPHVVHPVHQVHHGGTLDQVLQLGVAELKADDVIQLVPLGLGRLIVPHKLRHAHLRAFLGVHVHHIHQPPAAH